MNLGGARTTNGVAFVLENADDDAVDPHLERNKNAAGGEDSDEEDKDFVADKDDGGSPSDDSEDGESDASESGGEKERPAKKEPLRKKPLAQKHRHLRKNPKRVMMKVQRRSDKRRKKDPNAPKRAMSGFMFFANAERENLKKSNPGMLFTDVGSALGENWNKLTAEEKEPEDSMAQADSKHYKEAMAGYRSGGSAMNIDSGGGSDSKVPIP